MRNTRTCSMPRNARRILSSLRGDAMRVYLLGNAPPTHLTGTSSAMPVRAPEREQALLQRIVHRQRLEDDLRRRIHLAFDLLCELEDRHLGRVADVDGIRAVRVEEAPDALDQIIDKHRLYNLPT